MKPTLSAGKPRLLGIRLGLPLLAIAALFAAGCKTPPGQTLLERENFQQEKMIEDLKDQVEDAEHDLAQCRRENAALKNKLGGNGNSLPASDSPQMLTPPDVTSPSSHAPSSLPLFQPPKIDRGTEAPSEDSPAPPSTSLPEQWAPPKKAAPLEKQDAGATTSSYQEEDSPIAVRIALIRLLTNGHQFGGHTPDSYVDVAAFGDNGLQVAFSPRDAENRAIAAEGSVAMVVVDPAISGPDARVARWDFSPDEAKAHYRQTLFGKAYRFDLLWPHGAPQHDRLKLFVRLTTADGQRLEAQQTIHVRLGTAMPAPDDSNFADSPAPRRSEPDAPPTATGDDDADEPAPHGSEPPASLHVGVARNGAVWKPYR